LVEALLTIIATFFLILAIIDFSVAVYDNGAVVGASRVGARQASLFWIDPSTYDPDDLENNIRIKESMIRSGVDAYLEFLMRPNATPPAVTLDPPISGVLVGAGGSQVKVNIAYPYGGLFGSPLNPISSLIGPLTLRASMGGIAESDL
jgi:hypothetical protein